MTAESNPAGTAAAIAMRERSTLLRLVIMAVFAWMLGRAEWPFAAAWWCAYAIAQGGLVMAHRAGPRGRPFAYVVSCVSFAIAGAPTWFLWTHLGAFGVAAATMFLCGMMVQLVVSSLGSGRMFWCSAAPLIAYLLALPILQFGRQDAGAGATLTACGLLFTAYLAVAHRGQMRAIAQVEASRRQAEAASRAKSEFLSVMSHEIRTPMNAVMGAAVLLQRSDLTAEQAVHVRMLSEGGEVLMQILNDVLDLSKIEAGKLDIDPVNMDAHGLMERCASFWRPTAADAGLDLTVSIDPAAPRFVMLDGTRTGQIVFNLISNALKFTAQGGVTLSLSAGPVTAGRCELVLTVADTGMGMNEETLGRLFQAFEQADTSISRRFGGTGLGLSISQRLANMMGGRIQVSSTEGEGSRFALHLPVALGQAPDRPADSPAAPVAPDAVRRRRILVAEDNPSNQRIIDLFLRPVQAELTIVGNGQEAVDAAAAQAFDVILMDMQMPVMDGLEATRRIRAAPGPNAATPILALTANVMEVHQRACAEAGMTGHIAKPIDARVLITAVLSAGHADPAEAEPMARAS